jgi:cytochrome o ubiquinol oxidase subunit 1
MTGVLLAIPPVDYVMHNTTFLVAHFHNMLIPGALFGFFAGLQYWFPKAFGFELDAKWGNRSFWFWIAGFYFAFMPLYLLGALGMPRRMERYDIAEWQPYLVVAAFGALLVLIGLACMAVQFVVSVRRRNETRDLTGDPWDGRTLEWLTDSPPPVYNFAVIPEVRDIDAFWEMKAAGTAYRRPERYEDIEMPKSTMLGLAIGAFAFGLGFAMVWHIWWLVILCGLLVWAAVIVRASDDEPDYVIPADEVQAIENARFRRLAEAPQRVSAAVTTRAAGRPA